MSKRNIEELRRKLNHMIEFGYNYDEVYKVSVELDHLILDFYKNKKEEIVMI